MEFTQEEIKDLDPKYIATIYSTRKDSPREFETEGVVEKYGRETWFDAARRLV